MYYFIYPDLVNQRIEEWGGLELIVELCQMFEESFKSTKDNLQEAIFDKDFNEIRTTVHAFKSTCSSFVDRDSDYYKFLVDFERKGMVKESANLEEYLKRFFEDSEKMFAELKLILHDIKTIQAV
jgi:phage FluMu gp28-like protein